MSEAEVLKSVVVSPGTLHSPYLTVFFPPGF